MNQTKKSRIDEFAEKTAELIYNPENFENIEKAINEHVREFPEFVNDLRRKKILHLIGKDDE